MYELRHTTARFRAADTGVVYDAVPLIPAQRGAALPGQPSQASWWVTPYPFASQFELAANTDVLETPAGWLILAERLADDIEAIAGGLGPRFRVSLRDYDLDPDIRPRRGGGTLEHFVAFDVPAVADRVDPLRSRKGVTVFDCPPEHLPPVFRLSVGSTPLYVSAAAAPAFADARGIQLAAKPSPTRLDGCSASMLRVRDGDPLDSLDPASVDASELAQVDGHGLTALHHAVEVGNLAAARALLDAGADPNASTAWGTTPLATAAYAGHAACVELLLERGADSAVGEAAAGLAALAGHLDLCVRLYPLPRASKGDVVHPLAVLARRDREDLAIALASRVELDATDLAEGFRFALNRAQPRLPLALLPHVPVPTDPGGRARLIERAVHSGSTELVDAVLELGVPIDAGDLGSALAARCRQATQYVQQLAELAPMITHLLSRGADPTLRRDRGHQQTALGFVDAAVARAADNPDLTPEERAGLTELAAQLHAAAQRVG